ncbi:MAG: hypothetical protein ACRED8_09950 [Caulobacteraceae bacterium]
MTRPDEATIAAFVDGELPPKRAKEIENLARADARLAARIAAHRALKRGLSNAFSGALEEKVPARLLRTIDSAGRRESGPEPGSDARIVDLAEFRARRRGAGPLTWPAAAALAACVALGVFLGAGERLVFSAVPVSSQDGRMVAGGALAEALEHRLASEPPTGRQAVRVGLSLKTPGGLYCRTFTLQGRTATAGLACREKKVWEVRMAMAVPPAARQPEYQTAATEVPSPILSLVDQMSGGTLLDAQQERAARAKGWR